MKTQLRILLASSSLLVSVLLAQQPVRYTVSFPNVAHHEAQVTVEFSGIKGQSLDLLMSRSSPGRELACWPLT